MLLHWWNNNTCTKKIAIRILEVCLVLVTCCPHGSKIQLFQIILNWICILYKALLIDLLIYYMNVDSALTMQKKKNPVKAMQIK